MKKLLFALIAFALPAFAVDYEFVRGATDKFVLVNMYALDGTPKTGLAYSAVTATYTRNTGSADVDVTEATMTMGTHVDGGWIEVDATNSPGLYQFATPDAAIATGAESVIFSFKATDTFQRFVHASLIDVDLRNGANVAANTVQIEGSDATNQINAEADTALADYDPPTNAEMIARTILAANYFDPAADTVANVTTVATLTGNTPQTADHAASIAAILADTGAVDSTAEMRTFLAGSDTPIATQSAQTTAQSDISSILTDTAAVDSTAEMRAFLTGSDTPVATAAAQATAQGDLDILTGTNGATLATSQPNYAPYTGTPPTVGAIRTELETAGGSLALILEDTASTIPGTLSGLATASALSTHDGKLDTVDGNVDSILADTGELQVRFASMIEADGGDWRFDTNALEQAPSGGGGGGGDASEANQLTIIDHLEDMKGATFDGATDSLEAIRNRGDAAWGGGAGSGTIPVNHDTGGADTFTVEDADGAGIENALVMAYVKTEYDAGTFTLRGQTTTKADGTWNTNLMLNEGIEYTLVFYKPGAFGPATDTVTPEE